MEKPTVHLPQPCVLFGVPTLPVDAGLWAIVSSEPGRRIVIATDRSVSFGVARTSALGRGIGAVTGQVNRETL